MKLLLYRILYYFWFVSLFYILRQWDIFFYPTLRELMLFSKQILLCILFPCGLIFMEINVMDFEQIKVA